MKRSNDFGEAPCPDELGPGPVVLPVEDFIDLHPFRPGEIGDLTDDYLDAARLAGFSEVTLIHGRGTGSARAIVRSRLAKRADVASSSDASGEGGGAGATVVRFKAR